MDKMLYLRVFVLFIDDITMTTGLTLMKISKQANFNRMLYYNSKRIISGKNAFNPKFSLIFLLYLSQFFGVPCDIPTYLKIIAEQDRLKLLSEVPSDGLPT